jgi:hypothetical protein
MHDSRDLSHDDDLGAVPVQRAQQGQWVEPDRIVGTEGAYRVVGVAV